MIYDIYAITMQSDPHNEVYYLLNRELQDSEDFYPLDYTVDGQSFRHVGEVEVSGGFAMECAMPDVMKDVG